MKKIIYFAIILFIIVNILTIVFYHNDNRKSGTEKNNYDKYDNVIGYELKNLNRYIDYGNSNPDISIDKVVLYVNIGLDRDFYSFIGKANVDDNEFILVNKYLKLEKDYVPNDLQEINSEFFINGNNEARKMVKEAKDAFEKLSQDSIKNNTPVYGQSAYRSYSYQERLYNSNVKSYGIKLADDDTARPGFSEHQTGLAIDVSSTKGGNMLDFEKTKSFLWMKNNAYKYGFILRYPKKKSDITGYIYEAWHYRYVGIKIAEKLHNDLSDMTYDEYYFSYIK